MILSRIDEVEDTKIRVTAHAFGVGSFTAGLTQNVEPENAKIIGSASPQNIIYVTNIIITIGSTLPPK